jgi:hypothetical protein
MNRHADLRQLAELARHPWALLPEVLNALGTSLNGSTGESSNFRRTLAERYGARQTRGVGGVAVVPVVGVLTQRGDMFDELFGGGSVSTERLSSILAELAADLQRQLKSGAAGGQAKASTPRVQTSGLGWKATRRRREIDLLELG